MTTELTNAERETHLNMTADNRDEWIITSDDPVMQRRFEAIGATFVRSIGQLREYTLPANRISLRNERAPMSAERKAQLAATLRAARENTVIMGAEVANRALNDSGEVNG